MQCLCAAIMEIAGHYFPRHRVVYQQYFLKRIEVAKEIAVDLMMASYSYIVKSGLIFSLE